MPKQDRAAQRRLVVAVAGSAVLFALLWWLLPPFLYRHTGSTPEARLKAITDTRTALLAGLVGVGALLTFWLNRRLYEISIRTLQIAEEGQITDRYAKAVDQLGSTSPEVRVGGIYALRRIMNESESDHATIVDLLAVFVREHASAKSVAGSTTQPSSARPRKMRPDPEVQAALNVLGHRPHRPEAEADRLRLADTDLRGALLRGVHLGGANLRYVILEGARLDNAHLETAKLRGAWLAKAHLAGAHLTEADLPGADLRDAVGLVPAQLAAARVYRSTLLDDHLAHDPAVQARIKQCDPETAANTDTHLRQ
jgi:hypothetical protein